MSSIENQEFLTSISSFTSKLMKARFGKGPETCYTTYNERYLIIHFRKFMTPIEEVLRKQGNFSLINEVRTGIMKEVQKPLSEWLEKEFTVHMKDYFEDWDYHCNSGAMFIRLESMEKEKPFEGMTELSIKNQLRVISQENNQAIQRIEVERVNRKVFVANCYHTSLEIELILKEKGYHDLLRERQNCVKEQYKKSIDQFQKIFGSTLEDLFVYWDYEMDLNMIMFILGHERSL